MQQVRAAASPVLSKAEHAASSLGDMAIAVEKAAGALNLAVEMGKTRTELAKINQETSKLEYENKTALKRERSERIRDYVSFFTPLVMIITLAATLVAQNWQFLRSEQNKHEEALDAQWQDAVKTISKSGALSPGVIALQPFLRSPKYGEQAGDVVVNLLSNSSDPAFFERLFGIALTPVSWSNIDRLLRLDRALAARVIPVWNKAWDYQKGRDDKTRLSNDELAIYDYGDAVVPIITSQFGSALKSPEPHGAHTDFSATIFESGDWEGELIWTE